MEESSISVCYSYFISALLPIFYVSSLLKSNFLLIFYPITVLPLGRVTVTATTGDRAAVRPSGSGRAAANNILFRRNQAYLSVYPVYYLSILLLINLYVYRYLSSPVTAAAVCPGAWWRWRARRRRWRCPAPSSSPWPSSGSSQRRIPCLS